MYKDYNLLKINLPRLIEYIEYNGMDKYNILNYIKTNVRSFY